MNFSRVGLLSVPLALALFAGQPTVSLAASADDAGGQLVVPMVAYGARFDTRVFVQNHETHDVVAQVRYVGERSSPAPGLRICGNVSFPASTVTMLDVPATCKLGTGSGRGMLVLVALDKVFGGERLSARARVDVLDPVSGTYSAQSLMVDGIPLGYLDTTDGLHVATGLRSDTQIVTDCFFASFFDGSGYRGLIGRLDLKDGKGLLVGNSSYFNLRPFELLRFQDVFKLAGAPSGSYDDVRAEFTLTGGGDAVLGYCLAEQTSVSTAGLSTFSLGLAQVAEPQEETRRRAIDVDSTPVGGYLPQGFTLTTAMATHGIYVRHPDQVDCTVSDPMGALLITAVSPDGVSQGGMSNMTGEFATQQHSLVNGGMNDLWGLEVRRRAGFPAPSPIPYRIQCTSGNGTSLADFLF